MRHATAGATAGEGKGPSRPDGRDRGALALVEDEAQRGISKVFVGARWRVLRRFGAKDTTRASTTTRRRSPGIEKLNLR